MKYTIKSINWGNRVIGYTAVFRERTVKVKILQDYIGTSFDSHFLSVRTPCSEAEGGVRITTIRDEGLVTRLYNALEVIYKKQEDRKDREAFEFARDMLASLELCANED
jgi:hypothetical protein